MLGWKEYCKRVALTGMCGPGEGVCGGGGGGVLQACCTHRYVWAWGRCVGGGKEYCKRVALTGMCRPGEGVGGGGARGRVGGGGVPGCRGD